LTVTQLRTSLLRDASPTWHQINWLRTSLLMDASPS